jgi:hypothetical protein
MRSHGEKLSLKRTYSGLLSPHSPDYLHACRSSSDYKLYFSAAHPSVMKHNTARLRAIFEIAFHIRVHKIASCSSVPLRSGKTSHYRPQ